MSRAARDAAFSGAYWAGMLGHGWAPPEDTGLQDDSRSGYLAGLVQAEKLGRRRAESALRRERPVVIRPRIVRSPLTPVQVQAIRERYATGEVTQAVLAAAFGVTEVTISTIVRGLHWATAGGPISSKQAPGPRPKPREKTGAA